MKPVANTQVFFAIALCLVGCGDDDSTSDAAVADAAVADTTPADVAVDAGPGDAGNAQADAALDAQAPLGMNCDDGCAATQLEARFGGVTELFDVAYFGSNEDGTLHLEAYGGAPEGCPQMDSRSPDRTLIIGALPMPTDRNEVTVTASLLDFEGTLTPAPFVSTPTASVRPEAALAAPLDVAFVRMSFDASFEDGVVNGVIYATHCASLDE